MAAPNAADIRDWSRGVGVPAAVGMGFVNAAGRLPDSVAELLAWGENTGRYNPADGVWTGRAEDAARAGTVRSGPRVLGGATGEARGYTAGSLMGIFDRLEAAVRAYRTQHNGMAPSRFAFVAMAVQAGMRPEDAEQ